MRQTGGAGQDPGSSGVDGGDGTMVETYRIEDGPTHVRDDAEDALPGHYEAAFRGPDGSSVRRFLTDKGRAWLLQRLDEGRRELSTDELHDVTVAPDLDALVEKMAHESGDGA
jgi:hypothetical protein